MNKLKNFGLGCAAGLAIALGGFLNCICKAYLGGAGSIVGAIIFPIGLILVCFLGLQLYTGKIGFFLDKENKLDAAIDLLIMIIGNFIAAALFGVILKVAIFRYNSDVMGVANAIFAKKTASVATFGTALATFFKACFCGMLVYIAVYFYKNCKHVVSKVIGIIVPIAIFVISGFDHCVANAFYFGFSLKYITIADPLLYVNMIVAVLGNSVGAIALNALLKKVPKVL